MTAEAAKGLAAQLLVARGVILIHDHKHDTTAIDAALAATGGEMNDDKRVIWGLVHNAHNFRKSGEPLWSVVSRMAGIGSTWAKTLCLDFDMYPDDTGKPRKAGVIK